MIHHIADDVGEMGHRSQVPTPHAGNALAARTASVPRRLSAAWSDICQARRTAPATSHVRDHRVGSRREESPRACSGFAVCSSCSVRHPPATTRLAVGADNVMNHEPELGCVGYRPRWALRTGHEDHEEIQRSSCASSVLKAFVVSSGAQALGVRPTTDSSPA